MEKGGVILKNNSGFSLVEVVVSASIIFMLITIALPIITIVQRESKELTNHRTIAETLHDELYQYIQKQTYKKTSYVKNVEHKAVQLSFEVQISNVKGCASWEHERDGNKSICLYGKTIQ